MTVRNYTKLYKPLHARWSKWFSGRIGLESADNIDELIKQTGCTSLLDYGSGKGYQYLRDRIHERWGGILPVCYDIGVQQLSTRPEGMFGGVICTDIMEHIDPRDIDEIFADVCSYVHDGGFVYVEICCRPAAKIFDDGENVHLTVRPPDWWRMKLQKHRRKGLIIYDSYEWIREDICSNDIQSTGFQGLRS